MAGQANVQDISEVQTSTDTRVTKLIFGNSSNTRCDIPVQKPLYSINLTHRSLSNLSMLLLDLLFQMSHKFSIVKGRKRSHQHIWGSGQLLEFEVGLIPKPQVVACSVARVSSLSSAKWKWQKRCPNVKRETVSLESKFEDTQLLLEATWNLYRIYNIYIYIFIYLQSIESIYGIYINLWLCSTAIICHRNPRKPAPLEVAAGLRETACSTGWAREPWGYCGSGGCKTTCPGGPKRWDNHGKIWSMDWFKGKFTGNHGFYH